MFKTGVRMAALLDLSVALQSPPSAACISKARRAIPVHAEWSGEETEPAILEGKLAILLKLIISKVHMPFAPALPLLEKSFWLLSLPK